VWSASGDRLREERRGGEEGEGTCSVDQKQVLTRLHLMSKGERGALGVPLFVLRGESHVSLLDLVSDGKRAKGLTW
jgi:hypothetical protein